MLLYKGGVFLFAGGFGFVICFQVGSFRDKVSLNSSSCLRTHDPSVTAPEALRLQTCN